LTPTLSYTQLESGFDKLLLSTDLQASLWNIIQKVPLHCQAASYREWIKAYNEAPTALKHTLLKGVDPKAWFLFELPINSSEPDLVNMKAPMLAHKFLRNNKDIYGVLLVPSKINWKNWTATLGSDARILSSEKISALVETNGVWDITDYIPLPGAAIYIDKPLPKKLSALKAWFKTHAT
jgi:hypothetical protein